MAFYSCQCGRVVKAVVLKTTTHAFVGSNPAVDVFDLGAKINAWDLFCSLSLYGTPKHFALLRHKSSLALFCLIYMLAVCVTLALELIDGVKGLTAQPPAIHRIARCVHA